MVPKSKVRNIVSVAMYVVLSNHVIQYGLLCSQTVVLCNHVVVEVSLCLLLSIINPSITCDIIASLLSWYPYKVAPSF